MLIFTQMNLHDIRTLGFGLHFDKCFFGQKIQARKIKRYIHPYDPTDTDEEVALTNCFHLGATNRKQYIFNVIKK